MCLKIVHLYINQYLKNVFTSEATMNLRDWTYPAWGFSEVLLMNSGILGEKLQVGKP